MGCHAYLPPIHVPWSWSSECCSVPFLPLQLAPKLTEFRSKLIVRATKLTAIQQHTQRGRKRGYYTLVKSHLAGAAAAKHLWPKGNGSMMMDDTLRASKEWKILFARHRPSTLKFVPFPMQACSRAFFWATTSPFLPKAMEIEMRTIGHCRCSFANISSTRMEELLLKMQRSEIRNLHRLIPVKSKMGEIVQVSLIYE